MVPPTASDGCAQTIGIRVVLVTIAPSTSGNRKASAIEPSRL
jgi:hypothetical protein